MALYSRRQGRWISRPKRIVVDPDPYDPGSPDYAERNRQSTREMPEGLTRVDIGEPLP